MGRFSNVAARVSVAGAVALVTGTMMVVGVTVQQALTGPAFADSAPYETVCFNTPLGNIVLNDVVAAGALSPASPTVGQTFNLTGFQTREQLPASIAQSAADTGLTSLTGSLTTTINATGATPSSLSTGPVPFSIPLPNPIPPSGVAIAIPAVSVGPFTATSTNISLSSAPLSQTMDIDGAGIGLISLHCSSYPNNSLPGGFTSDMPPGLPTSPVIATAGTVTPPPPTTLTGAYELYCPHTPVGDLVFNDVVSSAAISPGTVSAGDQFQVTGYQTHIPIPAGDVQAAAGLGNSKFDGLATSYVDAYGTTSPQVPTGSMGFDVPIPTPVPSSGVGLDIPSSPATVGPFTALGGPITIAQDQAVLVVAELSGKAFTMSCLAYPNNSVATSGTTSTPPPALPIRPIIATASASGTPITTTTTTFKPPGGPGPGNQTPGAPYELYCPRTPVGDIAINDVVTTASITPAKLNEGDTFQITNLQTQFSIPQNVAQQAENLGLTSLSGNLSIFLNVSGTQFYGFGGPPIGVAVPTTAPASGSSGVSTAVSSPPISFPPFPPFPGPFPGFNLMTFNVTLPTPVPSTGVQFTATQAPGSQPLTDVAAGGPIQVFASGANLDVSAFGSRFGLFCNTLANNTVPTGLSIRQPFNGFFEPLIAAGSATTLPPPPTPPGSAGAYELFCPGTPVGNIVLNNVNTSGTITPAAPTSGQQFNLTGYQTTLTIPASIASAAAALGNSAITGTATAAVDANGATPAQISTGAMNINVPLPSPIPPAGISLTLPSPAGTIGPFTATGTAITIAQDASVQLVLTVSGSNLILRCSAYPNNSAPTGIVAFRPQGAPMSPVIAVAGGGSPPTTTPPTTTPGSTPSSAITQAYQTLFNFADPSVASKVAVIQDGASVEASLSEALSSSLATSATGANVAAISFPDSSVCTQAGLPSPCAQVTYDILGTTGAPILPNNHGYAVSINGTWLVAKNTICVLLGLFYQASGKTGTPPGCEAAGTVPSTPTTVTQSGADTTTTVTATTAGTTDPPTAANPTTTAGAIPTGASGSTAPPTTSAAATKATSSTSAPASTKAPAVRASSSSLAFTGPGAATGWIVVGGGALILIGLAMLALVDVPRRLRWALTGRVGARAGGRPGPGRGGNALAPGPREALWIDDAGDGSGAG
jgi:hypothetical protein